MISSGDEPMRALPTVSDIARNFSAYLDRVVHSGVQADRPRLRDLPHLLSALPHLAPEDIDAFESDLADIQPSGS